VTSGNLIVGGRSLPKLKRSKIPVLRRNIGCVFQDFKLLPNRNVYQNVAYALQVQGKSRCGDPAQGSRHHRVVGWPTRVTGSERALGGEQQRVSVARAFVNHPPLLIADEPTGTSIQTPPSASCSCCTASTARHHRRDGNARP